MCFSIATDTTDECKIMSHLLLSSVENGSHLCGGIVMAFCESVGWLSIRIRFGLLFVCVII